MYGRMVVGMTRLPATPNAKVSHRSQPPMTFDLPLTQPAGSGWLHRMVELSRFAAGEC